MADSEARRRDRRLELRTTAQERDIIDRAVLAADTHLTDFVLTNALIAAQRVLADRDHFVLDDTALSAWDEINSRPARELSGLRDLMKRPSPFEE